MGTICPYEHTRFFNRQLTVLIVLHLVTICRLTHPVVFLPYDKYRAVVLVDSNRKHSVCRRFRLVP